MKSAYTFGPTFRAEKSDTRRHLAEFYMVEAETVTIDTELEGILELIESLYKHTLEKVLERSSDDVQLFHDHIAEPEVKVGVYFHDMYCFDLIGWCFIGFDQSKVDQLTLLQTKFSSFL